MLSKPPPQVIHLGDDTEDTLEPESKQHCANIAAHIAKGEPMKHGSSLGPDYSVDKPLAKPGVRPAPKP